jgi:hypothetical protein
MESPEPGSRLIGRAAGRGLASVRGLAAYQGEDVLIAAAAVPGTRWWVCELAGAARLEVRTGTGWIKSVIMYGVALIILLSMMTLALARILLKPEGEAAC